MIHIGLDIANNSSGKLYMLTDTSLALFFPYDIVSPVTVTNAFNDAGVQMDKYRCRFYPETEYTKGQKRLDSEFIKQRKPEIVQLADAINLDLKSYVYVNIEGDAKNEIKPSLPAKDRKQRRTSSKRVDKRFTKKKNKRK